MINDKVKALAEFLREPLIFISVQSSLLLSVSCNALCLQSLELIQALFVRQFQLAPRCHRLNLYRIYLFVIIVENCFHPISFLYNNIANIGFFSVLLQVISLLLLYHSHTVTILQLYSNKAKSSIEDRLKFVCCSLNKRTTNGQQTNNKRTTDGGRVQLQYGCSMGRVQVIGVCFVIQQKHIRNYLLRLYACTGKPTASTQSMITHY